MVAAAAKDSNAEVRRGGYKALGESTSADAGPELLSLVNSGDPELKNWRLAGLHPRRPAIPHPRRPADGHVPRDHDPGPARRKPRLALQILKQIRTPESLAVAVRYLDQPQLSAAAATVAVTMSEKMIATRPAEVAAAMKEVLRVARNKDAVDKARGLLNRTGKK